jgi:hypothetical protein
MDKGSRTLLETEYFSELRHNFGINQPCRQQVTI